MKRFFFFLFAYLGALSVNGQSFSKPENQVWLSGEGFGMDFRSGSPQPVSNATQFPTQTAYASVCDKDGRLLFYTNGNIVWGRNDQVMENGWDINNNGSLAPNTAFVLPSLNLSSLNFDGVVIIPFPGSSHKYYIFSSANPWRLTYDQSGNLQGAVEEWDGMVRYSVVDMRLNGGLGGVDSTLRGRVLADSITGNLHAVPGAHCNYWLLSYGAYGDYMAFEITTEGVQTDPVVSTLAQQPRGAYIQELNVSPNGRIAVQNFNYGNAWLGQTQVSHFNPATGVFSNPVSLFNQVGWHSAFSPDNSKLYLSGMGGIQQFDATNFSNSPVLLALNQTPNDFYSPLRLGPDGKIYFSISVNGSMYGGCIHQPNLLGVACQMDSIPNPPEMLLRENLDAPQFPNEVPVLDYDSLSVTLTALLCFDQEAVRIQASDVNGTDYYWKRGSVALYPIVGDTAAYLMADTPGIYTVQYYTSGPCVFHQDTIIVERVSFLLDLGPDQQSCNGVPITLETGLHNLQHLWSDSSSDAEFTAYRSGWYGVQVSQSNCQAIDSIYVTVTDVLQDLGPDTFLCLESKGQEIQLKAQVPVHGRVLWSTGSDAPSISIADTGVYWVEVIDGPCIGSDSLSIAQVFCQCPVLYPNAFSPNGDGLNDYFMPVVAPSCQVAGYHFQVFNRWGQLVFVSQKVGEGWDGRIKGVPADVGTYMYHLQMEAGEEQEQVVKTGSFLLIR